MNGTIQQQQIYQGGKHDEERACFSMKVGKVDKRKRKEKEDRSCKERVCICIYCGAGPHLQLGRE
jgi:hypothetical protein